MSTPILKVTSYVWFLATGLRDATILIDLTKMKNVLGVFIWYWNMNVFLKIIEKYPDPWERKNERIIW